MTKCKMLGCGRVVDPYPVCTAINCPGAAAMTQRADERVMCDNCGTIFKANERHACAPRSRGAQRADEPALRDPLLLERQKTHGNFAMNADISQTLKKIFDDQGGKHSMCPVHREALDMIALKLSRILSGQANYKDHWDDIAGYAKLASEACKEEPSK